MFKGDTVHPKYPCSDFTYVYAVEDADYYTDRPAGEVHPADDPAPFPKTCPRCGHDGTVPEAWQADSWRMCVKCQLSQQYWSRWSETNLPLVREWLVDLVLHNQQSDGFLNDPLHAEVVHVSSGDLGTSFTHTRMKPTQPPPTSRPVYMPSRINRMVLRGFFLTKIGWDKMTILHGTIGQCIQKNLGPHLLTPQYKKQRPAGATQSWGCCYVASEALYHLGARELGWKPAYVKIGKGITHWFLVKGEMIMDLTADQFGGRAIPYKRRRLCGFMSTAPSKRTQQLMVAAEAAWKGEHANN